MPPHKLPVVSGKDLVKLLEQLGYFVERQQGSHIRMKKQTAAGSHSVTVPNHKEISKGTLSDILNSIALHSQIPKDQLIGKLANL